MKTIIQLITEIPYRDLYVLPILYELPKSAVLYIEDVKYRVDNMFDRIEKDGTVTRRIRVYPLN